MGKTVNELRNMADENNENKRGECGEGHEEKQAALHWGLG